MTSNQTDDTDAKNLNRRRLLQGIAATGAVTTAAGCLGDDDDDADDDPTDPGDDDADDGPVGVDDDDGDDDDTDTTGIQEGGRLEFAIERPNIDDYDQADSSLADDSTVFNAVYDGLFAQNPEGEIFLMMAEEYEVTDAQNVSFPDDYADYMGEYEIVDDEGDLPTIDLEWPNMVFPGGFHPEDVEAYAEGELGEGDTVRALTREEAGDAAEDGVYGVQIEGRLHEGIEFHNGDSCTAGDVVGSYDRMVRSVNEGQQFSDFLHAEAPDGDDGLDFVLYGQEADAIAEVALPPFWVFPEAHHGIEPGGLDPRDGGEVPIGTGPYEIAEFAEGSQLLLERTDNYWLEEVGLENMEWWDGDDDFPARPPIEEINVRFVPEDGTRVASLQDGEIDLAYQLPAGDRTAFDQDDNFDVVAAISTGFKFMQFPISEESAFQHREVRDAVSHLIPRRDIVEIVAEGWGAPARAPIPEPAAGLGTNMSYDEFENADFAFPENPEVETAEQLIEESPLDPPIEMAIRTNADDSERQDKMQIAVDELNASGLFEATLETPADIGDWTTQELYVEDATDDYGADNAVAVIGLASGFDPDGYNRAINHPDNYNICCNFFHPDGTFDWIDDYDATRFGADVAEDADLRRDRFDDIWPQITHDLGNTLIDYSLETAVAGPRLNGYAGYPDRRAFLSYGLYAPYDGVVAWLDDE